MAARAPTQLFTLRSRAEHARASRALVALFRREGARRATIRLHHGEVEAWFLRDLDVWLAAHELPNRYRHALGPGDPVGRRNLWPSVQLNLALAPGSARPHARFLRDARDRVWLAHSGQLGGRQPGISRAGFLAVLGGARTVTIDGAAEPLHVLGTFADRAPLLGQIARLAHLASEYRDALAAGLSPIGRGAAREA